MEYKWDGVVFGSVLSLQMNSQNQLFSSAGGVCGFSGAFKVL